MGNRQATIVAVSTVGIVAVSSGICSFVLWYRHRASQEARLKSINDSIRHVQQLYTTIEALRKEVEELKAARAAEAEEKRLERVDSAPLQSEAGSSRRGKVVRFRRTASVLSSTDSEYLSAWSTNEDSSEEFFDFSEGDDFGDDSTLASEDVLSDELLQIFDKVDSLFSGNSEDHQAAFELLCSYEEQYSGNVEFLWRLTRACRMAGQASQDGETKKKLSFKAVEYGRQAVLIDDMNAAAHKWFAIALGSIGDFVGVAEKIKNGSVFKEHIDKAMEIDPSDPLLYHLKGRFSYEISILSWIERKVASTLFTVLPTGSYEEALTFFSRAEELLPKPLKDNRLMLARCYIQLSKYTDAISWIDRAIEIPVVTAEDQVAQDELLQLQRKYSGYRSR